MKRILFLIVCVSLVSVAFAGTDLSDKNAQTTGPAKAGNLLDIKLDIKLELGVMDLEDGSWVLNPLDTFHKIRGECTYSGADGALRKIVLDKVTVANDSETERPHCLRLFNSGAGPSGGTVVIELLSHPKTWKDGVAEYKIISFVPQSPEHPLKKTNAATKPDVSDKNAQLIQKAEAGDVLVVQKLLANGADVNGKNTYGMTALWIAAVSAHLDVVKFLQEKGADINIPANNGVTPLSIAAEKGHKEIVKFLLEKGADVNAKGTGGITALWIASQNGHADVARLLLEKGADVNVKSTDDGTTALWIASQNGRAEVVKLLLEKGADVNAYRIRTVKRLELLPKKRQFRVGPQRDDANTNIVTVIDKTALSMAAQEGHMDVVKCLLENGADVNAKDTYGRTALGEAEMTGQVKVINLLVKNGADINEKDPKYGTTHLWNATGRGDLETVKCLLENGADINATTDNGVSALWLAVRMGRTDIVQLLKKAGARKLLPIFKIGLNGLNPVCIRNPNDFIVTSVITPIIKNSDSGINIIVPAKGAKTVYVPNDEYDIFFVYSDKPDALFQGDSFTLNNNGIEIQIVQIVNGNYNIRQVN